MKNLIPLPEYAADLQNSLDKDVAEYRQRAIERNAETLKRAETNRLAVQLLESGNAADNGINLNIPSWKTAFAYFDLDLGFFPRTKKGGDELAQKLNFLRRTLGCRLEVRGKDVGGTEDQKRVVKYVMRPVDFPGMSVTFERKLPKGAICKVVTRVHKYRSLECAIPEDVET